MYCSKCGILLADGSKFCPACGTPVPEQLVSPQQSYQQPVSPQQSYQQPIPPQQSGMHTSGFGNVNSGLVDSIDFDKAKVASKMSEPVKQYDYKTLPTEQEKGIHGIYFMDFLMRLTGKENIPLFLYLILNVVIIGLVACLVFALPIGWGMLSGFLIYFASVAISLSPLGEYILRSQCACKKIEDAETINRLAPIFHEVYYKAKKAHPTLSNDIRLFINEDKSPNAFATGRKTVCVTRGLLSMTDEEIKATLGHEFGHLAHKDTDRILVVSVGNTVISLICMLFQLGVIIGNVIMAIMAAFIGNEEGFFISIINSISTFISLFFVRGFMKIWTALGTALCMKTSRGNEYQADQFAFDLGFGSALCSVLRHFDGPKPKGLFANLASSHPDSQSRIARIQQMEAQKNMQV